MSQGRRDKDCVVRMRPRHAPSSSEVPGKSARRCPLCPERPVPRGMTSLSPQIPQIASVLSSFFRTPRPPHQPGHFQHRPPLRDLAVQARLRRENLHLPLAGGGPGEACAGEPWRPEAFSQPQACPRSWAQNPMSSCLCELSHAAIRWQHTKNGPKSASPPPVHLSTQMHARPLRPGPDWLA